MPEHHVFHYPGGKTIVAGETLEYLRGEADRRGVSLDELWEIMVAQEGERIRRHLEKN